MKPISKLCHFLKIPILYYPWSVGYAALSSNGAAKPKILLMIFQEYDVSMRWVTFIRPKKGFVKKKDIVIFLQKGFHPLVNFLS